MNQESYVLEIEWEGVNDLPRLVGPFLSHQEAEEWAQLNVPNGTWEVRPLAYPFYRRPVR